ncbi:type II toxin-antitoxin system RelE/ParE family toxin [Limosilactobacillus reuteri]|nr:type II toxin-antitoxin system RelE/ParE family toxin [Limosilactobacillus reuteri]
MYKNRSVEKVCKSLKKARKKYPSDVAEGLFGLINYLKAAPSLLDVNVMRIYNLHSLKGDRNGQLALDINGRRGGYRLICVPLNEQYECSDMPKDNLVLYYKSIRIIRIEEVSNHYE